MRVEPDAPLESSETCIRAPREDQCCGKLEVRKSKVWRRCQCLLGLSQGAFIVTAVPEYATEERTSLRIGAVKSDRPVGQRLDRAHYFAETASVKVNRLRLSLRLSHS